MWRAFGRKLGRRKALLQSRPMVRTIQLAIFIHPEGWERLRANEGLVRFIGLVIGLLRALTRALVVTNARLPPNASMTMPIPFIVVGRLSVQF